MNRPVDAYRRLAGAVAGLSLILLPETAVAADLVYRAHRLVMM